MLVDRYLIGTIVATVLGIDANLPGLREVDGVGRAVGVQCIVVNALDGQHTTVHGADAGDDMTQVAVARERVCVVDLLIVLIDVESDGIGQRLLIDGILTTFRGGMDITVHGRQVEGCDGCVVIISNLTAVV